MITYSNLESLPNELFYEIIGYLSGSSIYQAFFGLNSRLDGILRSYPGLHFEQREKITTDDHLWADRIGTLSIHHLHDIDISRYSNLRHITLEWPTKQQCNQIMKQSSLEKIYLGHPLNDNDCNQLIEAIFTNQFPNLYSCHIGNLSNTDAMANLPSILIANLKSFFLLTRHPDNVIRILQSCPNLERFYVKFIDTRTLVPTFIQKEHSFTCISLRRLTLDNLDDLSVEVIDQILCLTPNIKRLTIVSPRCPPNKIHLKHLANTLRQRLPSLNQLHTQIWLEDLDSHDVDPKRIDKVQSLHPLFEKITLSSAGGKLIISSLTPLY